MYNTRLKCNMASVFSCSGGARALHPSLAGFNMRLHITHAYPLTIHDSLRWVSLLWLQNARSEVLYWSTLPRQDWVTIWPALLCAHAVTEDDENSWGKFPFSFLPLGPYPPHNHKPQCSKLSNLSSSFS